MAEQLMNVQLSDHAHMGYTSLGADDRRRLDSWFINLQHWQTSEYVRSKSRRLEQEVEETYIFDPGTDLLFFFTIVDDTITIVSIVRRKTLQAFKQMAQGVAP